jgi:hypothetical protein
MKRGARLRKKITKKKATLIILYFIYIGLILMFTLPYFSAKEPIVEKTALGERIIFTEDGSYGHYQNVVLIDKAQEGIIELEYHYTTNTLYIRKIENIHELVIDCELMYKNKCYEVFGKYPEMLGDDYYKTYFKETNDGLFTVIISSNTPIKVFQFLNIPIPKSVLVNNKEWWGVDNENLIVKGDDVKFTNIPVGMTIVKVYMDKEFSGGPSAIFIPSKSTALPNEKITFDASGSTGDNLNYIWDFGDDNKGSDQIIHHTYTKPGIYKVTLMVRDPNYFEDTYSMYIIVEQ